MLYFGLLYNVFVIGKIWRKKMIWLQRSWVLLGVLVLLSLDWVLGTVIDIRYLYTFLMSALLFMPAYFIVACWIGKYGNTKFLKFYK
jgi:hypothetical protein